MELTIETKLALNDGHLIPQLGLGVWQARAGASCEAAVLAALEAGYRLIDTAAMYGNEESVGGAIRKSGIPREKIFVTTKLWNSDHGNPQRALDTSLRKLKLDYIDLYLIHYSTLCGNGDRAGALWRRSTRRARRGRLALAILRLG